MKNIIFIAPVAAGKGTQSEMLIDKYNYEHVSTGEIFREIINSGTEIGNEVKNIINSGKLVDDELTTKIVKEKLEKINGKPFILDGFPRDLTQAITLNEMLDNKKIDYKVIYLEINKETSMKRTLGRMVCKCGRTYNIFIDSLKPKVDGICDYCGNSLVKRDEDNQETFEVRYSNLMNSLEPVLKLYQDLGKVVIVDANQNTLDIFKDIEKVVIE